MSASPDYAAPDTAELAVATDVEATQELVDQMADVAAAMFALLLVQTPAGPAHQDIPRTGAEPAGAPEPAPLPIGLDPVPVLSIPVPSAAAAPVASVAPSIALPDSTPGSIPMPELALAPAPVEEPSADVVSPLAAPAPARTMTLLSEIAFLDD